MKRKIAASFVAPVAAVGLVAGAAHCIKNDTYALEDGIANIAQQKNISVAVARESLSAKRFMVKVTDAERVFSELGINNYKKLVGDYYCVTFDSVNDAVKYYDKLNEVAESVVLDYKTEKNEPISSTTQTIGPMSTYAWWGPVATGVYDAAIEVPASAPVVKVGVIDHGFEVNHEVYSGRVDWNVSNSLSLNAEGYVGASLEETSHGTGTAGIIANATQSNVKLYLETDREGLLINEFYALSDLAENGVKLVNISLGSDVSDISSEDYAQIEEVMGMFKNDYGMIIVASSGNYYPGEATHVLYPAASAHTLAIGSVAEDGDSYVLSDFSSYGPEVDFVAPGEDTIVAVSNDYARAYSTSDCNNNCYEDGSDGTSFASPLAVAAIANILSTNSNYGFDQVKGYLMQNAVDLGTPGFDNYYGNGMIYLPSSGNGGSGNETPNPNPGGNTNPNPGSNPGGSNDSGTDNGKPSENKKDDGDSGNVKKNPNTGSAFKPVGSAAIGILAAAMIAVWFKRIRR